MKEKSVHQFNVEFISSFEGLMCVLNGRKQSHHYWALKYSGSVLIGNVRAIGWEGSSKVSGGGMDSLRRFGVKVSSPKAFLCAFSSCLECLLCWSSWMSRVLRVWELSFLLVGVGRTLGIESG